MRSMHGKITTVKMFCPTCLKCKKDTTSCCDQNMVPVYWKARAPKVTASRKKWQEFYRLFLSTSPSQRVIDNMRKMKMDVTSNLAKQAENIERAKREIREDYIPDSYRLEETDEVKAHVANIIAIYDNLQEHFRWVSEWGKDEYKLKVGKKYFVTSSRKYWHKNEIFNKFCKDYNIKEITLQKDKSGSSNVGFYELIGKTKVFRNIENFACFNTEHEAKIYQWILHNQTDIYPYKKYMDKMLKRNDILETNPEYFL